MVNRMKICLLLLLHSTNAYLKWIDYCEAIKKDEHSTFLPDRFISGDKLWTRGGEDEINEFFEDPHWPSSAAPLETIENQLTSAERARRCDAATLRAPLFSSSFPAMPTCSQVCGRCFPDSSALCVQRRPKLDLMRTCLCTYNTQSPISGAIFSFRHDKRVEQLLRG